MRRQNDLRHFDGCQNAWVIGPFARWTLLLAAVLVVGLCGCGPLDPVQMAERAVADYARRVIGPADSYRVHIDRRGTRLRQGRISRLVVEGIRVRSRAGLVVNRAEAELYDVQVDVRSRSVVSVGRSLVVGEVLEDDANAYVAQRQDVLRRARFEFLEGRMAVTVEPQVAGLAVPIRIEGQPRLGEEGEILFEADMLRVARLNVPRLLVRLIERRINPVFRVDELGLPLVLEEVRVEQGRMIASGRLDVEKLPTE